MMAMQKVGAILTLVLAPGLHSQSFSGAEIHLPRSFSEASATADFDGDGVEDVVAISPTKEFFIAQCTAGEPSDPLEVLVAPAARILLSDFTSDPVFTEAGTTWALGDLPVDVVTGEFGGPGVFADFAVLHRQVGLSTPNEILLFQGNGSVPQLDFLAPISVTDAALSGGGQAMVAAELNGDSMDDLAVIVGGSPGSLALFLSSGGGFPNPAVTFTLGGEAKDLVIDDFVAGGRLDIAVVCKNSDQIEIFENDPITGFAAKPPEPLPLDPLSLSSADFDGDGHADLVVGMGGASGDEGRLDYFRITESSPGTLVFEAAQEIETAGAPGDLVARDIDGDGHADLVMAVSSPGIGENTGYTYVYRGEPQQAGSFSQGSTFTVGIRPLQIEVEDFDGDSIPDILSVNGGQPDALGISYPFQGGASAYLCLNQDLNPSGIQITFDQILGSTGLGSHVYSDAVGGGAVVGDFDRDGHPDLYVIDGADQPNRVFLNRGLPLEFTSQGTPFLEVTNHGAEAPELQSTGAVVADFNNDGWEDIYVASSALFDEILFGRVICESKLPRMRNELFINDGDVMGVWSGTFHSETVNADVVNLETQPLPDPCGPGQVFHRVLRGSTRAVSAADFDGDGWLDIYTGNFFRNGEDTAPIQIHPQYGGGSLNNASYGMPNGLFYGEGVDGSGALHPFTESAMSAGVLGTLLGPLTSPCSWPQDLALSDGGSALGVFAADMNGDGLTDIYVANDMDAPDGSPLYVNTGNRTFVEVSEGLEFAWNTPNGMGCDIGDFNGDGAFDISVSDTMDPWFDNVGGVLLEARTMDGQVADFEPAELQLDNPYFFPNPVGAGFGWHVGFEDFDNDGDEDIHVTSIDKQTDKLYRNDGANDHGVQTFVNVGGRTLGHTGSSMGAAYADFDQDGWVDVFLVNPGYPVQLYMNRTGAAGPGGGNRSWLQVRALTTSAQRDAIGARVVVAADVDDDGTIEQLHRIIQAGEGAAGSMSEKTARFGLGSATSVSWINITWPDGTGSYIGNPPPINQLVTFTQPVKPSPGATACPGRFRRPARPPSRGFHRR